MKRLEYLTFLVDLRRHNENGGILDNEKMEMLKEFVLDAHIDNPRLKPLDNLLKLYNEAVIKVKSEAPMRTPALTIQQFMEKVVRPVVNEVFSSHPAAAVASSVEKNRESNPRNVSFAKKHLFTSIYPIRKRVPMILIVHYPQRLILATVHLLLLLKNLTNADFLNKELEKDVLSPK